MPDKHVYLDTSILQPKLWEHPIDETRLSSDIIDQLRGQVSTYPRFKVKIPHVVIGECMHNFFSYIDEQGIERPYPPISERIDDVQRSLEAEIVSPNDEVFRIAAELLRDDTGLTDINDVHIAGQAICDYNSQHLITTDDALIKSEKIDEIVENQEGRPHRLKVIDYYG